MFDRLLSRPDRRRPEAPLLKRPALWVALAIIAGTFSIDVATPRGVAAGAIPYYLGLFMAIFTWRPGVPLALAALASVATMVGFLITGGGNAEIVLTNRVLVALSLFLFAFITEALIRACLKEDERIHRSETEAAEQVRALQSTGMLLRQFTDNSPSSISFIDNDRRIRFVNRQFRHWFDVTEEEVLGQAVDDFGVESPGSEIARYLETVAAVGPGVTRAHTVTPVGGAVLRIETYGFTVPGAEGGTAGLGVISRDVTELRQAEAELFQSQKMQAVGQLTGGLAHDFNNFLTIISGNLQLVLQGLDEESRDRPPLSAAMRATQRASELTRRLLAFGSGSPVPPQRAEINDVVRGLNSLLRTTLGQSIEIETRLAPDGWAIHIDKAQLENALLNITINARDAMPGGGRLLIETSNVVVGDAEASKSGGPSSPGRYLRIRLTDTGLGMPKEVARRVFEPFFTTKDTDKGSGLGMTMVYAFITQAGGSIAVDSAPGEGTAFTIMLPADPPEDDDRPALPPDERAPEPSGGERLLVVDDEEDIRVLITHMVAALGYRATACADGREALDLLETGAAFDLLITDIVMPGGIDGYALARGALAQRPDMPVLFVSGYVGAADASRDEDAARGRMLPKPFTRAGLARAIRDSLKAPSAGIRN